MIVVDASAVLDLILRTTLVEAVEPHLLADEASLHAPDLLDAEVLGALRRRERRGEISAARGEEALEDLRDLPIALYPARPLLGRAWELRENLTAADGLYVALAEALEASWLTTDTKAAKAVAQRTTVELLTP